MSDNDLEMQIRATLETDEIREGLRRISSEVNEVADTTEEANSRMREETEKTGGIWTKVFNWSNAVSLVKDGAGMIIDTVKQIGAVVMDFRDAADDSGDAVDALNLQLENMGMYTDETSKKIQDFAEELQDTTNFSNEDILGADTLLLTFRNISEDILPEATERLLDMSAVMGQDLKSSSIQLGKALSDPVEGISALSRVGITFTEQQKESIKKFVEQNDIISAQKIILNELNTEFRGHAKLQVDAVEQSKNAWQSFMEVLGTRLQPVVDSVFIAFSGLLGIISDVLKVSEFDKVTEDISAQKEELNKLSYIYLELKDKTDKSNVEQKIFLDTINELKEKYPDFLGKIDLQNIKTAQAIELFDELNNQLERKYINMMAEAELGDKYKELVKRKSEELQIQKNILEIEAKRAARTEGKAPKIGVMDLVGEQRWYDTYKEALSGTRENIEKLEIEIADTKDKWNNLVYDMNTKGKKTTTYTKPDFMIKLENDIKEQQAIQTELDKKNTTGTGEKDKTKYSIDTSESAELQKSKLKKELEEKQKNADEWEKQINVIETEKAIAEIEAKTKYDNKIKGYEKELEKNNTIENKKRLDAKVTEAQKELATSIATTKSNSNDKIKAIQEAKQAEADAEKKAEEKYEQDKEARIAERERKREQQRENVKTAKESDNNNKIEKAYKNNVIGITDVANYGVVDYDKKLYQKRLDAGAEFLANWKKQHEEEMSIGEQKKRFNQMTTQAADMTLRGLIETQGKGSKALREGLKQQLKDYLYHEGTTRLYSGISNTAKGFGQLASGNPQAAATFTAAAYDYAAAAAFSAAGGAIKMSGSSSSASGTTTDTTNKKENNTTTTESTEKKQVVYAHADLATLVENLSPVMQKLSSDGWVLEKVA